MKKTPYLNFLAFSLFFVLLGGLGFLSIRFREVAPYTIVMMVLLFVFAGVVARSVSNATAGEPVTENNFDEGTTIIVDECHEVVEEGVMPHYRYVIRNVLDGVCIAKAVKQIFDSLSKLEVGHRYLFKDKEWKLI